MDYTEKAFATIPSGFFDRVHAQLKQGGSYIEPTRLPTDFRLTSRVDGNLRGKNNRAEVFRQGNGPSEKSESSVHWGKDTQPEFTPWR